MALVLIPNPESELKTSAQWGLLVERASRNMTGIGLSIPIFTLTNWDAGTVRPEIAMGSIIESGNSLYRAESNTALTDDIGLTDGVCHIKIVPNVDGTILTAVLTSDPIPAWSGEKSGWYDGADKFLPFEITKTGTVYSNKQMYIDQNKTLKQSSVGDFIIAGDMSVENITVADSINGQNYDAVLAALGF